MSHRGTLDLPRLRAPTGVVLFAVCTVVFAALAADLRWFGPVTRADVPISTWFHLHAQPMFTMLLTAVSHLHGTLALCLIAMATAIGLTLHRQTVWLPLLGLCIPGGLVLNWLVKQAFQRARPAFEPSLFPPGSFSFPSGHTAGATVWWGFALLLWFAWERRPGRRLAGSAVALAMVLLTALSRVYLGAHYPSDVLAAMAEGAGWLVLSIAAAQTLARFRPVSETES